MNRKNWAKVPVIGIAMGIAEIIPGVSGGTIALISGIYERLMDAIKSFDMDLIKIKSFREFWDKIDGDFLLSLGIGMFAGLVIGAFGISYLFDHYPLLIWGFFFGLILASSVFVLRSAGKLTVGYWVLFGLGVAFAFIITKLSPVNGSESLWYIYLCGMIAITALMMPGISGSFMLILLGAYHLVLSSFKGAVTSFNSEDLWVILVFILGALSSVILFSRLVSWFFKNYRTGTLAVMAGFLVGSLNKVWPWRNPLTFVNQNGHLIHWKPGMDFTGLKVLTEINVLPSEFSGDPMTFYTIISMIFGLILVFYFELKG